MSRTLTTTIEDESAKARLRVIDLVRITFPLPVGTAYWSNSICDYGGNTYVPRVLSIGTWKRSMSAETEDLTITLANSDGLITRIYNAVNMELAELSLIRYYPDLNEAIEPLWVGYGGTLKMDEETAEWKVHFGFRGMTQRALRKITSNCWKLFNDGEYCPYNPTPYSTFDMWIGLCAKLTSGIDADDTTFAIYNIPAQGTDIVRYVAGDVVKIDDEEMLVVSATTTSITVTRAYNYTTAAAHVIDSRVFHNSCTKTHQACRRRGMHGPPENPPADDVGGLRYFGGWEKFIPPEFYQRYTEHTNAGSPTGHFGYISAIGNASVQGRILPVIYGEIALTNIPAVYGVDAREFVHALYIVSEGEVSSVATNTIVVNNLNPDNVDLDSSTVYREESCLIWWGSTGQRYCYAANFGVNLDTYANNPYLINSADGDGPSLSDVFAVRIRIEEDSEEARKKFDTDLPTLDFIQIIGKKVRTIQGLIDNDPTQITTLPDPIEVAVDFCTNKKFGPRLDVSRINLQRALIESQYCRENITSTDESEPDGTEHPRFKFNGEIKDDKSAEAMLALILETCNGYYIQNDGKMEFGIRKAELYSRIDEEPTLTDTGDQRNILRQNGKSTLAVEDVAGTDGYVNQVEVSFANAAYGWQRDTLYIFDDIRQTLAAKISNTDSSRCINNKQVTLLGTTSLDQATRLGALRLREEYLKKFKYTFKMSLKDSVKLCPGDIRKLSSAVVDDIADTQLSKNASYIRIWTIEETDKFVATLTAYKHDNDLYDNTPV